MVGLAPPEGLVAPRLGDIGLETGRTVTGQDFALTPGALRRGRVIEAGTGKPVAGVTVLAGALAIPSQEGMTDAEGRCEIRVPPGKVGVDCMASGDYVRESHDQRAFEVQERQVAEEVDLILKPPRQVKGVVLDLAGNPAAGAQVRLQGDGP